jgi:Mg-chelatase subunit ChlD
LQNDENQSIDGIDIIIVLDVSKSMNALDFEDSNNYYSRIDAAKLLVKNYVTNNPQNRY